MIRFNFKRCADDLFPLTVTGGTHSKRLYNEGVHFLMTYVFTKLGYEKSLQIQMMNEQGMVLMVCKIGTPSLDKLTVYRLSTLQNSEANLKII